MKHSPLFTTPRLRVRTLVPSDFEGFYALQSNLEVMQYVTGNVKDAQGIQQELHDLIGKYTLPENDFWIFAVCAKDDHTFMGTCAFVKDIHGDDEIGYRLLPEFWNLGFGTELCRGMLTFAPEMGCTKLMAYVADKNPYSARIVERCGFTLVKKGIAHDLGIPETIYQLIL